VFGLPRGEVNTAADGAGPPSPAPSSRGPTRFGERCGSVHFPRALVSTDRKYALSRIAAGDYLLPSNDGQTIWRIARYQDGPSSGLDLPRDRTYWGVWRWTGRVALAHYVDIEDWDQWDFHDGFHQTRAEAMRVALG
jgi:hypothetical protein